MQVAFTTPTHVFPAQSYTGTTAQRRAMKKRLYEARAKIIFCIENEDFTNNETRLRKLLKSSSELLRAYESIEVEKIKSPYISRMAC